MAPSNEIETAAELVVAIEAGETLSDAVVQGVDLGEVAVDC